MDQNIPEQEQILFTEIVGRLSNPSVKHPLNMGLLTEKNLTPIQSGTNGRFMVRQGSIGELLPYSGGEVVAYRTTMRSIGYNFGRVAGSTVYTYDEQLSPNFPARRQGDLDDFVGRVAQFLCFMFVDTVLRKYDYDVVRTEQTIPWNYGWQNNDEACAISEKQIAEAEAILQQKFNAANPALVGMGDRNYFLIASDMLKSSIRQTDAYTKYTSTGYKVGEKGALDVFEGLFMHKTFFFNDAFFKKEIDGKALLSNNIDGAGHKGGYAFLVAEDAFRFLAAPDTLGSIGGQIDVSVQNVSGALREMQYLVSAKAGAVMLDDDAIVRIAYRYARA